MKYKCPCCGYYTFNDKPDGNYDICPVCFWEDDPIQLQDPNYAGGANKVSLLQGQKIIDYLVHVRKKWFHMSENYMRMS